MGGSGVTDIQIDYSEFEAAAKRLQGAGFGKAADKAWQWASRQVINAARRNIRARAKPHKRTGRMADHVRTRFRGRGMDQVGGVRATGSGSNLIVGGVKPHRIAGSLMPMWKGGSIEGFSRAVEHPGFAADPFVDKGIEDTRPEAGRVFAHTAETMAKALADIVEGR